jgi:hypothetical protein
VASDDNESRLPAKVERALAEAREKAAASSSSSGKPPANSGRWLALVPMSIAFVLLVLMMPRSAPPDEVPLPNIDRRALDAVTKDDVARAERAHASRLRDDVLAVGSAIRAYQRGQAESATVEVQTDAKLRLENALNLLLRSDKDTIAAYDALRSLRAVQLDQFLAAVKDYEATGKPSDDLVELGGSFIERMRAAGWLDGTKLLLDDAQRRAAFKTVWTAVVVGNAPTPLVVAVDEQRVLYSLYITRPHAPEGQRKGFDVRRSSAASAQECARVQLDEAMAAEMWRAEKIRKLGELDPSYPTNYALGVSFFKAGHYDDAAQAFQKWLEAHPDGPWTLRARNHLKAALVATGP